MRVVILAGGFGSRLSEETQVKPKPMVEIGGKPILWHIMKIYAANGITDFIICCGYKGHLIKEYFANYFLNQINCRFDLQNNRMEVLSNNVEPWSVTLIDTGENTMTGGRLKRVRQYVGDETFCLPTGMVSVMSTFEIWSISIVSRGGSRRSPRRSLLAALAHSRWETRKLT